RGFVDRVEIKSGQKERIFEGAEDWFERVSHFLDDEAERLVILRESRTEATNAYLWQRGNGLITKLTENQDHTPEMTQLRRERFQVTRVDGFKFWVEVTYPPHYVPGARFPAFFWFYPREFTNQEEYNRNYRTFNKNSFPSVGPRSMEILALRGYVFVEPDCPIVGPSGRMNDYYIVELRNSLTAVIDELDRRGIIDRSRLGIGGHSYGAFSTANAMIHTPYFKAGIAGDGNFNRTLTPATFQNESRILWEARETYLLMSPLLWAEWLNGALLLYHGEEDQNVGTDPINSERMFHALNSLGKKVALYMYPYEDHSPQAKETILDLWARWVAWLDKHLKGQPAENTDRDGG
ncbi:MAG: prolyl oligopeptidase family serine peptidase, partial [Candidatus Caldarchaeum sp.]